MTLTARSALEKDPVEINIKIRPQLLTVEQLKRLKPFFDFFDQFCKPSNNGTISNGLNGVTHLPSSANEVAARTKTTTPEKNLIDYFEEKPDKPIIFFDIESTGLNINTDRILNFCFIKLYPDGKAEAWNQLVGLPDEVEISEGAFNKHGIKKEDLKGYPSFEMLAPSIFKFIGDGHLGGFNISGFDIGMLTKEFERTGIQFSTESKAILDVQTIFHKNVSLEEAQEEESGLNGKRTLTAAYKYYCGEDLEHAHTAGADAIASIDVLKGQFEKYDFLPRRIYDLSKYCQKNGNGKKPSLTPEETVGLPPGGYFKWVNKEIVINFGNKHKDQILKNVIESDPRFITWVIEKSNMSSEVKEFLAKALKGEYPKHLDLSSSNT